MTSAHREWLTAAELDGAGEDAVRADGVERAVLDGVDELVEECGHAEASVGDGQGEGHADGRRLARVAYADHLSDARFNSARLQAELFQLQRKPQ